ncbi:OmpA family protein [Aquimarina hainanensis]|uniref:OmpA family protein n=2 Tax=Aquimarina hainanensis TaxID=1578017 RepID=A0ABW5NDB1_9FLAO
MKSKKILILLLLISGFSFSQKKTRADRFFEKGDFINAAIQYEEELNKEGYSKEVLGNISTSYYNTFQFKKAYRYLKNLVTGRFYNADKNYDNKYNFMMYQVLSAMGKYEKAVTFLTLYKKNKEEKFNKNDAIEIIENFKLKEDDYTVEPVTFNSDASEFGAVKIDSLIYFTSDRKPSSIGDRKFLWTHRSFLDIYKIKLDENKQPIEEAVGISDVINTKLHEGNFTFSRDMKTLYFSKSNSEKGKKKFDSLNNNAVHLYKAELQEDGEWSAPKKLLFNDVSYSIEHPALNQEENRLYFSSNMPGGFGGFDIYYVEINPGGDYGPPINLGSKINTAHRDQFPFIDRKGNLFFSSDGHLGLGMLDIFVCEKKKDGFVQPVNLGAPLNSSYDDFSITYYNETEGFFASNRKKTGDDIYEFVQTGEIFLREYIAQFEVRDFATEEYIPNADVKLEDDRGNKIYENQLDSVATFFRKILPGKYDLSASSEGYEPRQKTFSIKEKNEEIYVIYLDKIRKEPKKKEEEIAVSIPKKEIPPKKTAPKGGDIREKLLKDKTGPPVVERNGKLYFDLPPIYFDYNKWNIRQDSKKVLDDFAKKLDKYKSVYIKIISHTDNRGSDSYNQVLSEKRAESTRNYLALEGYVNARRMKFLGMGESQPLIDCGGDCSEEEHQVNRRSEFEIVKY